VRDGFIFYESFRSAMKGLPAETQVLLYNAIADYALYDMEPDFDNDGIASAFFALVRPQIDANNCSARMLLEISSDDIPI